MSNTTEPVLDFEAREKETIQKITDYVKKNNTPELRKYLKDMAERARKFLEKRVTK